MALELASRLGLQPLGGRAYFIADMQKSLCAVLLTWRVLRVCFRVGVLGVPPQGGGLHYS